jgi:hypothetical protein
MSLLDRLAPRRSVVEQAPPSAGPAGPVFSTKALPKFLASLTSRETPVLLDLGPVVGSNVSFFGEQLGCKILVFDLFADWDRHIREGRTDAFPDFMKTRFDVGEATVDGVLCWDILDYLDRPAADTLAKQLARILRAGGALLALFDNDATRVVEARYTKYMIVDETSLKSRPYAASRGRHATLPNRDILRLFGGLKVVESFLLKNNLREILFRKPTS